VRRVVVSLADAVEFMLPVVVAPVVVAPVVVAPVVVAPVVVDPAVVPVAGLTVLPVIALAGDVELVVAPVPLVVPVLPLTVPAAGASLAPAIDPAPLAAGLVSAALAAASAVPALLAGCAVAGIANAKAMPTATAVRLPKLSRDVFMGCSCRRSPARHRAGASRKVGKVHTRSRLAATSGGGSGRSSVRVAAVALCHRSPVRASPAA